MKKEPLISIITTVYNTEKYVERCFNSIMNQTYKSIEFIVVDNGSKGDIKEIVESYREIYPERNIRMINLKENVGLFHGRLKGAEIAKGDYIAFIDSDDRVSIDFYRCLLKKALETGADMVASDVLLENENGDMSFENLNPFHFSEIELKGSEIAESFFEQKGLCYYWHLVWNKIYSRSLFEKCLPHYKKLDKKLVMCDDMSYSSVFYCNSEHFVSTNNCYYYYYKRSDAYTANTPSVEKLKANIDDVKTSFDFINSFIIGNGFEKYVSLLKEWENRYFRIWCGIVRDCKIKTHQKKLLEQHLLKLFSNEELEYSSSNDSFFYQVSTHYNKANVEWIKEQICDKKIKYISFDIFDTMLLRPVWEPTDLFRLMDEQCRINILKDIKLKFSDIRIEAESEIRQEFKLKNVSYEEVTLDEIYSYLGSRYNLKDDTINQLKEIEIEFEKRFCKARKVVYDLYEMAVYMDKKIICISDMYLDKKTISNLIQKNGYNKITAIFVSSEYRESKHTGNLYKTVLKTLKIKSNEILHIGDNYYSDVEMANKNNIRAIHIPKTVDVFMNRIVGIYGGGMFDKVFGMNSNCNSSGAMEFIGIRSILATIANKFMDNPFVQFNITSDFNANPYLIGYSALGTYLYSLSFWLHEQVTRDNKSKIHFIARDGYILKKAYEIISRVFDEHIDLNYLYVSRKSLVPLMICNKEDIYNLDTVLKYSSNSPKKIIDLLKPIISKEDYVNAKEILKKQQVLYEKTFSSKEEFNKFMKIYEERFYSKELITSYREKMKMYFSQIIDSNDCTFDIGYSGRTEMILSRLLEQRIDANYIHLNNQIAYDNSHKYNFKINTFMDYSPKVAGPIRELIMSDLGPSCRGYKESVEGIEPSFAEKKNEYIEKFIITHIHEGAIDFVTDMQSIFGEYLNILHFRYNDAAMIFEYFINRSSNFDRVIFNGIQFEDDLFLGKKINACELWNNQTSILGDVNSQSINIDFYPRWKKAIFYAMFNREMLKCKVKSRYECKPVRLATIRYSYRLLRGIYRTLK